MIKKTILGKTVYFDRALAHAPYAQCGVDIRPDGVMFVSYFTPVIFIDNDGWLECSGTYSATTRKQIGCFLREYAPQITYNTVKVIVKDNMKINIHTGEVREL